MDNVAVVIKKLDGRRLSVAAGDYGASLVAVGYNADDSVALDLSPSDIKHLHEYLGKALEHWDQSEI